MKTRKTLAALAAGTFLSLSFMTAPAIATDFGPAQNENACKEAKGVWYDPQGNYQECTVSKETVVSAEGKVAGKSGKSWSTSTTTSSTTKYTKTGGTAGTEVLSSSTVIECRNPGGQLITEDLPKHCMP
jgi:hypothetical protein